MLLYQPPTPPSTSLVYSGRTVAPQVKATVEYVGQRIPPVNPEIMASINDNLARKTDFNRAEFIEDVKSDPVIFLQCARRLSTVLEEPRHYVDPLQALSEIEQERLQELFEHPFPTSSQHRLQQMTKPQALALKLTIACAKYAEALSKKTKILPSTAFTNALFRQAGLALIAWNYPTQYASALTKQRVHGADLFIELEKRLGLSARTLGHKLAQSWGVHLGSAQLQDTENKLEDIVDLAEVLALCEEPDNFPKAEKVLATKEQALRKLIDESEIKVIRESVEHTLARFSKISPAVENLASKENSGISPLFLSEAVLKRNPLLTRTNAQVKVAFGQIYSKLQPKTFSTEALKQLVEQVIPALGFARGCLLINPKKKSTSIEPVLRFGEYPLSAYYHLINIPGNDISGSLDMLTACRKNGIGVSGEVVSYMTAGFNHFRHLGVLYLELNQVAAEDPNFEATLLFKVTRQAIMDCFDGA